MGLWTAVKFMIDNVTRKCTIFWLQQFILENKNFWNMNNFNRNLYIIPFIVFFSFGLTRWSVTVFQQTILIRNCNGYTDKQKKKKMCAKYELNLHDLCSVCVIFYVSCWLRWKSPKKWTLGKMPIIIFLKILIETKEHVNESLVEDNFKQGSSQGEQWFQVKNKSFVKSDISIDNSCF